MNEGEGRIRDFQVFSWSNFLNSLIISWYKRDTGQKRAYKVGLEILNLKYFWNILEILAGLELSMVSKQCEWAHELT